MPCVCSLVNLVLYCVRIFTFTLLVGNCRGSFLVIDGKLTIPFQVTPSVNLSLQIAYAVRCSLVILVLYRVRIFTFTLLVGYCR